ncbi:hypothetical protein [Streptomyces sp. H72]
MALSRGQNLLVGAALHAAARLDRGLEATELEVMLLRTLRAGADDDSEVASWGRAFAEQRSTRGGVKVFPSAVNRLDVEQGYDLETFRADLEEVTAEIVAQPNVALVVVGQEGREGEQDSEEFVQALAEYGSGLSVYVTAQDMQPAGQVRTVSALPAQLHLKPSKFYAERRSDEIIKDEIYWAMAAGTDGAEKKSGRTPEFRDLLAGHTRHFTDGHALTLVDGRVRSCVALNIECWEADDSDGGFYNKMRQVIAEISERLAQGSQEQMYSPPDREFNAGGWMALLSVLGQLLNALLGWLTNDDDLVCERSIGLTRTVLEEYFTAGGREKDFLFDGGNGGRHRLYLHGTIAPIPARGRSRYVEAGRWSTQDASVGGSALLSTPPVGVSFNGSIGAFLPDRDTHALRWVSSLANTGGENVAGAGTTLPPAAAVHDGKLYCAHIGGAGDAFFTYRDANSWRAHTRIQSWQSRLSPALASHNGRLYYAHVGMGGSVLLSVLDGDQWSAPVMLGGWQTATSVALASHGGRLYCAHIGMTGIPHLASSTGLHDWSTPTPMHHSRPVIDGPALASYEGKLYYALREDATDLFVGIHGEPGTRHQVMGRGHGTPSLAPHGNRLYVLGV